MQALSRRDLDFLLHDWLQVERLTSFGRFSGQCRADYDAVVDLAERLAVSDFLPCYKAADREEPRLDPDGEVIIQPDLARAIRRYLDAGLQLAAVDAAHGGMQLPTTVATAAMAQIMAANIAGSAFMMLSAGNARVLSGFGTQAQIDAFARPQFEGRALGTMCLSEPDAGSSLGDIATRAFSDGIDRLGHRFRLTGRKM